jgi:hypothetical protein
LLHVAAGFGSRSNLFDLWHLAFANLIQHRAPPSFEVQSEVRLTIAPQLADMLLLRRKGAAAHDHEARVLRRLWPWLGRVTVLEYKSPVDSAFRPGDLLRLVGYGVLYETAHLDEVPGRDDLTLVLVVASITPTLLAEIGRKGWTLTSLGGGYARIEGVMYSTYVVVTDEVTEAERDEYLRLFSHRPAVPGEAAQWLRQWMRETRMKQPDIEDLPEFKELFKKTFDKVLAEQLAELTPEERLAGLAPEQVLGAFAPEQVVAALPLELLRVLPEDYLGTLPADVQETIRKRLQGASH